MKGRPLYEKNRNTAYDRYAVHIYTSIAALTAAISAVSAFLLPVFCCFAAGERHI